MANQFTYQVLKDTNQKATIKLTGFFDGSSGDEANSARIAANGLYGALDANGVPLRTSLSVGNTPLQYYGLSIERIWFEANFAGTGHARLYWAGNSASNNRTIIGVSGQSAGAYNDNGNWVTIPNNAAATGNCPGDIGIQTFGTTANATYNIVLELRKDNRYYSRGQFEDPAAFNYPPYNLKP